jgi:hypothetical protein
LVLEDSAGLDLSVNEKVADVLKLVDDGDSEGV